MRPVNVAVSLSALRGAVQLDAAAIGPGTIAFAAFLFLALKQGGFPATAWYPAGIYLLALLAAIVLGTGWSWLRLSRAQAVAVASLAAYAIWSLLSISWAEVKGDAWDGANRTLLYVVVFALFSILPWQARSLLTLLGIYAVATAVLGLGVMIHVGTASDPASSFIGTRLSSPTGYQNATAALFMAPVWAALLLGARREVAPAVRGIMLACGGLLVDLAVLGQSRGWLYAAPVVALLYLALVPRRLRSVLAMSCVAGAVLVAWPALSRVYDATGSHGLHTAIRGAWGPVFASCAALFTVGIAWGLFDRLVSLPEGFERWSGRILGGAAAVSALVLVAIAFSVWGAGQRIAHSWHDFTTGTPNATASSHFSSGLGGGRYDFWRVALDEFKTHPLGGEGADNFALDYVRLRHVQEEPKYPHSVELRILAGTGAVGAVLFLGFLGGAFVAAIQTWRRGRRDASIRAAVAGAVVTFAYWWIHGSVDWFWEFPALTMPALAFLAAAGALGVRSSQPTHGPAPAVVRRGVLVAASALALFAVVSFLPPWLAARDVAAASSSWRANPGEAADRLGQAHRLNFLSDQADLVRGAIASTRGDWRMVRSSFRSALARNPRNWYPYLELGVLDALQGNDTSALRMLARVRQLNPLEPTVALAIARMREGRPLTFSQLDRIFVNRVRHRLS